MNWTLINFELNYFSDLDLFSNLITQSWRWNNNDDGFCKRIEYEMNLFRIKCILQCAENVSIYSIRKKRFKRNWNKKWLSFWKQGLRFLFSNNVRAYAWFKYTAESIRDVDLTLVKVARWLILCHFGPLLAWPTTALSLSEIDSSLKPNQHNQVKL